MTRHDLAGPYSDTAVVVDELGRPDGPPLVYLHSEWGAYDAPPLGADVLDSFRVLAVHLPGWGVSSVRRPATSLGDVALLVWWALDRLDVASTVLVGHGIGATTAAEMAAAQPARVGALVMMAPFGLFDVDHPGVDIFALLPRDAAPALYADLDGAAYTQQNPRPSDAHESGLATIRRVQVLGAASNYLFPIPDTGIAERLYRLTDVPTLLLWGESDGVVPPELAASWLVHLPHARSEVLAGVAHMLPYESAAASAATLAFLNSAERVGSGHG